MAKKRRTQDARSNSGTPAYYQYDFVLSDECLELELPFTLRSLEPLAIQLSGEEEPGDEQLEQLIEAACAGDFGLPQVSDACLILTEFLSELLMEGFSDWDEDCARRLGRLIGLASFFDPAVDIWRERLGQMISEADSFIYTEHEGAPTLAEIKDALKDVLQDEHVKLFKRVEQRLDVADATVLNLKELGSRLRANVKYVKAFLESLREKGEMPQEWKGRRWRIPSEAVSELSPKFSKWLQESNASR